MGNKTVNSKVLDLFSGTGSLGIESLSRGCKSVHFVDNSFIAIEIIKHNVKDSEVTEVNSIVLKSATRHYSIIQAEKVEANVFSFMSGDNDINNQYYIQFDEQPNKKHIIIKDSSGKVNSSRSLSG